MMSLVLTLPAAHRDSGNAIAVALGHDVAPGNTYSVPLSADGVEPATHYGCRTWASPGFVAAIEIARNGVVPDGTAPQIAAMGLSIRAQHPETLAALIADARETDAAYEHWSDVLAAHGLAPMRDQMEP
jgi:hypothetical protein